MTVAELIAELQKYDSSLPVALGNWSGGFCSPSIEAVTTALIQNGPVDDDDPPDTFVCKPRPYGAGAVVEYIGTYVCIGDPAFSDADSASCSVVLDISRRSQD